AQELQNLPLPIYAVLGNHDYHSDQELAMSSILAASGISVLEGDFSEVETESGETVGIAGTIGFGGGFQGACASDFGERQMKDFIGHTKKLSERLRDALNALST